jgi:hypothetical protein
MARTMLDEHRTSRRFWAEAVNTMCYVSNRIFLRAFKKKTCYEMMHGHTPKVSHFHVFGCKYFILKKGKNLDKFEARSVDGILFVTLLILEHFVCSVWKLTKSWRLARLPSMRHSHAALWSLIVQEMMNLEMRSFWRTSMNMVMMKTAVWVPVVEHVPTTSITVDNGPSPTPTTTSPDQGEAVVEGEVASRREPPWRVQMDHLASRIISDMNERTTRSRVRNNSHFAHAAFVATFEPNDIGHALSDHNWVNSMHELENFERNQVWQLVDPPPGCKLIGTKWVWKNKEGEKQVEVGGARV